MSNEFLRPEPGEFPWLDSQPEEFQARIWRLEWKRHLEYVDSYSEELVANYKSEIAHLEDLLARRAVEDYDLLDYFFPENEEEELEEDVEDEAELEDAAAGVNPFTGEAIRTRVERSDEDYPQTAEKAEELLRTYREIVANPGALIRYRWDLHWHHLRESTYDDDDSIEWDTVSAYLEGEEHEQLFDSFHTFYGRDPEDQRVRISYLAAWDEAHLAAKAGDSSKLDELTALSELAKSAQASGRRLTKEYGDCYICKKLVKANNGELLLWNEIPKSIREEFIPGVFKKWHVRHLGDRCARDEYGKRIPLTHVREVTEYRNQKAEPCWMCGNEVSEGDGWLVHSSKIPKWKQAKRAFPGAKVKQYYVQCNKGDD